MLCELVEVGADLRGRADGAVLGHLQNLLTRGGVEQHVRFVVRELASASEKKADARTLGREEVLLSLLMGVGGDDVDARDDVRLRQLLRRLELASVDRDGVAQGVGGEVRGKCIRQAEQDRKSVGEGKSVSVRVDLGGRRIIKKKNRTKTKQNNI